MQQTPAYNNQSDLTIPFKQNNETQQTNQHLQFVPVIIQNNTQQNQQQIPYNYQYQPQNNLYQYQTNTPDQNLLQNLTYSQQKTFIGFVLSSMLIWSILEYVLLIFMIVGTGDALNHGKYQIMFILFLIVSIILLGVILHFGIKQKTQNNINPIVILAALIVIHCLTLFCLLCSFFGEKDPHNDSGITFGGIVAILFFIGFIIVGACTFFILVYALIEQEELRIERALIGPILALGFTCIFSWVYLFYLPLVIIYTILLTTSLKKILKGKYNLRKNQFSFGLFCVYKNLIFPFECV